MHDCMTVYDVLWLQKHTASLLTLCREKGATEEELTVCRPRRHSKIDFTLQFIDAYYLRIAYCLINVTCYTRA